VPWKPDWCEKRRSFVPLYRLKAIILPRQARDRHREDLKKRCVFRRVSPDHSKRTGGLKVDNPFAQEQQKNKGGESQAKL
jgi:hypothetical protein